MIVESLLNYLYKMNYIKYQRITLKYRIREKGIEYDKTKEN